MYSCIKKVNLPQAAYLIKNKLHIFLLLSAVFYLPIFNGRVLDIFYLVIVLAITVLKRKQLDFFDILIVLIYAANSLLVTLSGFFHGNYDLYYTYFILRLILLYVFYIRTVKIDIDAFNSVFPIFLLINLVAIILDYLNIPLTEYIFYVIKNKNLALQYRASGLYTGYYTATIMSSVMIIYFYYQKKHLSFFLFCTIGFFSLLFSGRSGFIVFLIFFLFEIVLNKANIRKVSLYVLCILTIILLFFIIYPILPSYIHDSIVLFRQVQKEIMFDFEGTSSEALFDHHYYLKNSLVDYIFGNNAKPFSINGEHSDSGYIQLLYGIGFFSTGLYFFIFIYLLIKNDKGNKYFIFLFLIMVLLSIKGSLFYSYIFLDYLFMVFSMMNLPLTQYKDLNLKLHKKLKYD